MAEGKRESVTVAKYPMRVVLVIRLKVCYAILFILFEVAS